MLLEHSKNLQNDYWRKRQFLRSSASKKHPFHKFSTGSLETLEIHADLRDQLIKFHSANYSSSIMRLCVLGSGMFCFCDIFFLFLFAIFIFLYLYLFFISFYLVLFVTFAVAYCVTNPIR